MVTHYFDVWCTPFASQLRPYDLIVRLGGDEFLCAMPGPARRSAA
jgi:GGDEF domain-containing protein